MTIEGRWQLKTLQAQMKQQALLELAQLRVEAAERATLAQRPRGSVAAIAEAWLNSFALQVERGERSIRTLDYYRSNYRCHVEAYFGSQCVDEVGPDETSASTTRSAPTAKRAHVVRACSVLSRIFKFAIRRRDLGDR